MRKVVMLCLIYLQAFASGALVVEDQSDLKILTPSFKDRKTIRLKLDNGLSVFIVSDKSIDKSSAALCVKAGSWQDPENYAGMAHFTEHMLFMGSYTYPGENAFMNFIWDHGGCPNAYTACDRTVYGFSINNDAFTEGLNRFAHFFIDPIIPPSGMARELHAVDQEYAKNIENDGWRKYMIEKAIANPKHPHRGFSTGNSKTLGHIPQEEMLKWIEGHYSANIMHLFVYSPMELEQLQKVVVEKFSKIPNRNIEPFTQTEEVFSEDQKGKIVFIKPVKDLQLVSISWELPKEFNNDSSQSAELLAYTFTRGSNKSLLQLLKNENLAIDLDADVERIGDSTSFFQLEVSLTNEGIRNYKRVYELCFEALKTYKKTHIPDYLYKERKKMKRINYEYQSKTDAFDYAMRSADKMADENLATYPAKRIVPKEFNKGKTERLLDYLTYENASIYVLTDPKKINISLDQKEKWLGGQYTIKPLPKHLDIVANEFIALPEPNSFIPSTLELQNKQKPLNMPTEISRSQKDQAYFYPDTFYQVPEVSYLLQFQSPYIEQSPLASCMIDLWICTCYDHLTSTLLSAQDAGLSASISKDKSYINIAVNGFSDKADLLLQEVLKTMKKTPTKEQFTNFKHALGKSYLNKEKELPVAQASYLAQTILIEEKATPEEKNRVLEQISYETYLAYQKSLFQKTYLEALYTGNVTLTEAKEIHKNVMLLTDAEPFSNFYSRKILHFPKHQGPFMIKKNTQCQGNACLMVLDEGNYSFQSRAVQQVLSQGLRSDFFATLRTKQKTGYIAKSWDTVLENQLFQFFAVQSSTHEPLDLLHRFDSFLDDYSQDIKDKISYERFISLKKSLIDDLQTPPINLSSNAYRLQKLAFEFKDFSWIEKRVEGLESLTYAKFTEMATPLLSRLNKKRIAILYSGQLNSEKEFRYEPTTAYEIRKISSYFPKQSM